MDVNEALKSNDIKVGQHVELSGWLVDKPEGLFLLGDHSPENYNYPQKIRITNGNIIYPILGIVPSLGGGQSLLFYRAKLVGTMIEKEGLGIHAERIFVQSNRDLDDFKEIPITPTIVEDYVKRHGDYKFSYQRNPLSDWMDGL
ncbi:hypothetical protein [Ralstonia mojiangensis]|uniref:hypothetical protein n=1 Tax=Ralstonia mojiangensis TaxID=2953895 RepID=UPI0021B2AC8A|nr:hypothetical protein [Ralstonia mojiangensis]MCT7329674.1 hypothetical protein [Ralstonia mojiangensis]